MLAHAGKPRAGLHRYLDQLIKLRSALQYAIAKQRLIAEEWPSPRQQLKSDESLNSREAREQKPEYSEALH